MKHVLEQLREWNACEDGYAFSEASGVTTLDELWQKLERPDWMIWLLRQQGVREEWRKPLVLWAIDCAKDAEKIWDAKYPNDKRVRECIEATEGYLAGTVTLEELRKKRYAAYAAHAAAYAYAAYAGADAAAYADADAAYAAHAAAHAAAYAAAYAYADADAWTAKRKQYANSLRSYLPHPFEVTK